MQINLNEKIKSKLIRSIGIVLLTVVCILVTVGIFTKRVKNLGPIEFNTSSDTSKDPNNNYNENNGIKIEHMEGDIIKDSAIKNEYNYNK